jgi:hypothetical protein
VLAETDELIEGELPVSVQDTDKVNLGTVVSSCTEMRLLNKLIKNYEKETGNKIRKVNKS